MARSRNFGLGTPRLNEGIIVSGSSDTTALKVYHNVADSYAATIDNDNSSAGHGLKITSDGTGTGTYLLDIEAASTTLFRFRGDGRLGIGTITPGQKLTVEGDIGVGTQIVHKGDSDTFIEFDDDDINIEAGGRQMIKFSEGAADKVTINNGGMDVDFHVKGEGISQLIRTDAANDRVGIGTQNPSALLHVDGDSIFDGSAVFNEAGADKDFRVESQGSISAIFVDASRDTVVIHAGTDMIPGNDTSFFISGAIGGKGSQAAVMTTVGGDFVTSGSTYNMGALYQNVSTAAAGDTVAVSDEFYIAVNTGVGSGVTNIDLPEISGIGSGRIIWVADVGGQASSNNIAVNVGNDTMDRIVGDAGHDISFTQSGNGDLNAWISYYDPSANGSTVFSFWFKLIQ